MIKAEQQLNEMNKKSKAEFEAKELDKRRTSKYAKYGNIAYTPCCVTVCELCVCY